MHYIYISTSLILFIVFSEFDAIAEEEDPEAEPVTEPISEELSEETALKETGV